MLQRVLAEAIGPSEMPLPELNVQIEREVQTITKSETPMGRFTPDLNSMTTKN